MEIRVFEPGDEQAILELFLVSFGKPLSKEFWNWRYRENPFSETTRAHLMWDSNKLVGHYAVCPVNMIIENTEVRTALSMTTMTHPEYTGKGIFKDLAESLYEELYSQHHTQMVWGFPNLNSHYGFIKNLKWNDVATVPTLKLKKGNFTSFKPEGYVIHESFADNHSKHLSANTNAIVKVNKTTGYLNWRYMLNPVHRYYIISPEKYPEQFAVIKCFQSFENPEMQEVDILELGVENNPDVLKELIGSILLFTQRENLDLLSINTWLNLSDNRHVILEKNKFTLDSPTTILGNRLLNHQMSSSIQHFKNWGISMGDSDVY
jgi:GNAT superfamily N-acetyltransferase